MRKTLAFFLALFAVAAQPAVTLRVPKTVGEPFPAYFTSTNVRLSAHASVSSPQKGFLEVNGQEAYHGFREVPDDNIWLANWNVSVMIDSTAFPHGSTATVTWKVKDNTGAWHQMVKTAPVKNRLIAFEHPDPNITPDAVPVIQSATNGKNYFFYGQNGGSWNKANYLSNAAGAGIVHYTGHGNTYVHLDALDADILPGDYAATAANNIGTGYPPLNSTGSPPIHYLHLDACLCGVPSNGGNPFSVALLPHRNYYVTIIENQSFQAYATCTATSQSAMLASMLFTKLMAGKTAKRARDEIVQSSLINAKDANGNYVPIQEPQMPLYGDQFTRLKNVYTGTDQFPSWWSRVL